MAPLLSQNNNIPTTDDATDESRVIVFEAVKQKFHNIQEKASLNNIFEALKLGYRQQRIQVSP